MGLSRTSTGKGASVADVSAFKSNKNSITVCLAGNPNVGKSTVFNSLTGMNQHTGNWTGKTVSTAVGKCNFNSEEYIFADLPGCYSLNARSAEEEVARDFVYFGNADKTAIVCDASCLERNFFLVLQIIEACDNVVLCINLVDEAQKKGFSINADLIEQRLNIPVVLMSAKNGKEAYRVFDALSRSNDSSYEIKYKDYIENYIKDVSSILCGNSITKNHARAFALRLLDSDSDFTKRLAEKYRISDEDYEISASLATSLLLASQKESSISGAENISSVSDDIADAISDAAFKTINGVVTFQKKKNYSIDQKLDRLFIGRITAFPIMICMLFAVLWLTIKGANYPSVLLSSCFSYIADKATHLLIGIGASKALTSLICDGIIGVVGKVISVMLPPMAIFFPLFTVLEDIGYLPRVAFNLDRCFKKCSACGKQALTMCMGFGCNAAGVVGCRIIDSPRERLIAMITNNFMPCNGRFPMLIALISICFASSSSFIPALILGGIIIFSVFITLAVSKLLSKTVLKGIPSSFTLELPSYRTPKFGKIILRSIFDRTVFVLGRAIAVAAPTGLIIWFLANISINGSSILTVMSDFFDPFGQFIGLDGVIILSFIIGLPANEIVIPVILMCYTANGTLVEYNSLSELKDLLFANGWTILTTVNMIIFTVFHWPCSTTLLTIKKESQSLAYTVASALIPTAIGITLCLAAKLIYSILI